MRDRPRSLTTILFKFIVAFVLLAIAIFVLLTLLFTVSESLTTFFGPFPKEANDRYVALGGLSSAGVALLGVGLAIFTFASSAASTQSAEKKRHTISILRESRFSDEFMRLNVERKDVYPPGQDIDPKQFYADYTAAFTSMKWATCRRKGAEALVNILNYYEFISIAINEGDLDEPMLRKFLRGMMCRAVDDARLLIQAERAKNAKTFEHLVDLYENWRDPEATDSNGAPNERPIPR